MDKTRAAMQQALDALEEAYENGFLTGIAGLKTIDTITVMREALAEQAEQEPVAWYSDKGWFNECGEGKPLYAAPVRTKDLTDENVAKIKGFYAQASFETIIRAAIAADREKNK